jgi:hypothetical protein
MPGILSKRPKAGKAKKVEEKAEQWPVFNTEKTKNELDETFKLLKT